MKASLALAALILLAASFFGWRGHTRLAEVHAEHERLVEEGRALGIDGDAASGSGDAQTKSRRAEAVDKPAKVKAFAAELVAFAKEMEAAQKSGQQPGEEMQKKIFAIIDKMLELDASELKLLVAELRATSDLSEDMRNGILSFAVMMLANDHPAAALALFAESGDLMKDQGTSQHVLSSALARLAQDDPMAALDWIRKNAKEHPELAGEQAKRGVLAGAARQDPKLAFSLIAELGFESSHMAVRSIVDTAVSAEERKAMLAAMREHVKTLNGDAAKQVREQALNALGQNISQAGYDSAMTWLASSDLSAQEMEEFAQGVQPWQTKAETGKWITWMADKFPKEEIGPRMSMFMRQWANDDYKAAGEWLNDFKEGPTKEVAVKSYADAVLPYDPATAAEWSLTMPAGKEKTDLMAQIYRQWRSKDEAAAEKFAEENGIQR
ncbi:hypothetical protein OJ996_07720 [Luteolibacter sp. GHJ8]|uniref:HEAT repeat protein n=1 Tax=Luteolibacter rhizosphaerae TaxID=2989719 RepID=A0ABT3G1R2_9BACT|nr:hypothetical protein [Luteolibacter rhizosphaerae]MCW1913456.1 hypothetical protein [Luteolibacter rhizosphaerae]